VRDEHAAEDAQHDLAKPIATPLAIAVTLIPALLMITSALLPWAETAVRVISPVELPALGIPAGANGRRLSFAPIGYQVGAGQVALFLGLLGAVFASLRRGRELMLLSTLATCHACIAMFVLVARNGADHLASFERSLADTPLSSQASLGTADFQPEIGVLLYLASSYLLLLSTSVQGAGVPLQRRFVAGIDRVNGWIGTGVAWLALLMVLVGGYNAIARKLDKFSGLSLSSNAYIEAQWYMFSLVFLLGAAWTLREDGHVRVDVLYGRLSPIGKARIDLAGTLLFLLPFCVGALWFSLPSVINSWQVHEISPDPGGLPRYPLKLALPTALVMIALQGHAMAVRQVDTLRGRQP
jgi:TRAP-type mannitol/chloroaromatic compound transport system permease small subunit